MKVTFSQFLQKWEIDIAVLKFRDYFKTLPSLDGFKAPDPHVLCRAISSFFALRKASIVYISIDVMVLDGSSTCSIRITGQVQSATDDQEPSIYPIELMYKAEIRAGVNSECLISASTFQA
jgi:hypothetical protein